MNTAKYLLRAHREVAVKKMKLMASIAAFSPGIVQLKIPTSAQISRFTTTWLSPRVQYPSKIVENSAQFERISQQKQTWRPPRSSSGHAIKAIVMSQFTTRGYYTKLFLVPNP